MKAVVEMAREGFLGIATMMANKHIKGGVVAVRIRGGGGSGRGGCSHWQLEM